MDGRTNPWRIAGWSAAALVIALPLVAMQFTDQVNWSAFDFLFAIVLIGGVGGLFELAVRKSGNVAYRSAVGVALAGAFLLIWLTGAVGIIGSEKDDANLMYFLVLAIGVVGAVAARFQPRGMSRALFATAVAQTSVTVIALVGRMGAPESGPFEIVALNGFFVALFVVSATLFQQATLPAQRS